jgi:hypothetical protein
MNISRRGASVAVLALFVAVVTVQAVPTARAQATPAAAPAKPLSSSLGMVVFPAKNQTPQKQSADEGECFAWSKGQTGVDPLAPAPAPAPAAPAAQPAASSAPAADGSRARGALRGAAAGAVIGEVANNDAGQGAAVGATAGVLAGGAKSRRSKAEAEKQAAAQAEQQAQQQTQQQQAAQAEQRALFNKGFAACLEARGYTVK